MLRVGRQQELPIEFIPQTEMKNQHSFGRNKRDIFKSDALPRARLTSMAVFSFLRGLKRGSVFLVFFMTLMISSTVKSFSIFVKEIKIIIALR
jgi:hypothetical protein